MQAARSHGVTSAPRKKLSWKDGSLQAKLREYYNEASDEEILALVPQMDEMRVKNPYIYNALKPFWDERLAKVKERLA